MMRKIEDFSYFCKKKQQFTLNYYFFCTKIRKILHFPHHGHFMGITLSNLELLVQPSDGKAPKTLKLFIFLEFFLVCSFPTNIRNFRQKRPTFLKRGEEKDGKQTNSNFFFKTDKIKTFVQHSFPNSTGTQ